MARCESVSQMKGGPDKGRKRPRKGTRIGNFYDLFMQNKGVPVYFSSTSGNYRALEDLRNYYGLDIVHLRQGVWLLAGEWFGKDYHDYLEEVIMREENGLDHPV